MYTTVELDIIAATFMTRSVAVEYVQGMGQVMALNHFVDKEERSRID
jgi:hypothetical protein